MVNVCSAVRIDMDAADAEEAILVSSLFADSKMDGVIADAAGIILISSLTVVAGNADVVVSATGNAGALSGIYCNPTISHISLSDMGPFSQLSASPETKWIGVWVEKCSSFVSTVILAPVTEWLKV